MSGLALRIDVDYAAGLERAVPFFLDELGKAGMTATFFVVAGRNQARPPLRRLARPGYLRRLWRLGPVRAARALAGAPGAMLSTPAARAALRRIEAAGCELAVHGHDHAWWTESIWRQPGLRVNEEISAGFAGMEEAAGPGLRAWGSPGWRTSDAALSSLAARQVPYLAECWGTSPFLTRLADHRVLRQPHLPITLPSMESLILDDGGSEAAAVAAVLAARRPGADDVLCVHDYFEGLLRPALFPRLLSACREHGLRTERLAAMAARQDGGLPICSLEKRDLPGFSGAVSWQGEPFTQE